MRRRNPEEPEVMEMDPFTITPRPPEEQAQDQALTSLADIYGPDLSDLAREEAVKKVSGGPGAAISMGLGGLGKAISQSYGRGGVKSGGDFTAKLIDAKRQESGGEFDKKRKFAVGEYLNRRSRKESLGDKEEERDYRTDEREKGQDFRTSEREAGQKFTADQNEKQMEGLWKRAKLTADAQTGVAGQKRKDAQSKAVADIRKEVQKKGTYEASITAMRGMGMVREFAKDPNGFTDYGTLMAALKSLQGDTSTIREAELQQGKNATSLVNAVLNRYEGITTGKGLQQTQREEIFEALKIMAGASISAHKKATVAQRRQAMDEGLPLDQIFTDLEGMQKEGLKEDEERAAFMAKVKQFAERNGVSMEQAQKVLNARLQGKEKNGGK